MHLNLKKHISMALIQQPALSLRCLTPCLHGVLMPWARPFSHTASPAGSRPLGAAVAGAKPGAVSTWGQLVDSMIAAGVLSDRAAGALRAVDRSGFVQAYQGVPETIAYQVCKHTGIIRHHPPSC